MLYKVQFQLERKNLLFHDYPPVFMGSKLLFAIFRRIFLNDMNKFQIPYCYFLGDAEDCLRNVRNLQHKASGIRKSWKALAATAKRLKDDKLIDAIDDETLVSYFLRNK